MNAVVVVKAAVDRSQAFALGALDCFSGGRVRILEVEVPLADDRR
jgi:hypothetical protein